MIDTHYSKFYGLTRAGLTFPGHLSRSAIAFKELDLFGESFLPVPFIRGRVFTGG